MTRWCVFLSTAFAIMLVTTGIAQTFPLPQDEQQPIFRVQVWGFIVADFSNQVKHYFELRSTLGRHNRIR